MAGSLACEGPPDACTATTRSDYHDNMEKFVARHSLHQQPRDTEHGLLAVLREFGFGVMGLSPHGFELPRNVGSLVIRRSLSTRGSTSTV